LHYQKLQAATPEFTTEMPEQIELLWKTEPKGKYLVSAGARWPPARLPATVTGSGASRKRPRARRMEWRTVVRQSSLAIAR
jgi:hypothetical protein